MPKVQPDEVDALARLARLRIPPEERAQLAAQLGDIVAYIDALAEVELGDTLPWQPPAPTCAPLRADEAAAPLPAEALLAAAPRTAAGLVIVPRFVES